MEKFRYLWEPIGGVIIQLIVVVKYQKGASFQNKSGTFMIIFPLSGSIELVCPLMHLVIIFMGCVFLTKLFSEADHVS